jgi:dipeptidase E
MQNIKENKRIYLSGGGNEKQSFPLDKFFFRTLPKNGRFLYIPIALRGHKLYPTANLWMKSIIELHERTDVQFETADNPSKYQLDSLKEFNGIYIGGGNTWSLIKELKESGFSDILIQYLQAGGQAYGGSAGAIIMGKRIDTHDDENKINLQDTSGFNLLNNFSVACHFKDEQNDRFKIWATNNNLPIICLPEETGLMIENSIALCVGTKPCIIYFADDTKKEVNPEESFNL